MAREGKAGDLRCEEKASDWVIAECWAAAGRRLDVAQTLIEEDDDPIAVSRVAAWRKTDATYEKTVRHRLLPTLVNAKLARDLVLLKQPDDREEAVRDFEEHMTEISETLDNLTAMDSKQ